ncbi:protein quick-to-court-like isoform X1 [Macrosteles quadrilineatus]|uniref:protein quick-to-court-like isoform X1 n=1 Tax=Macrosteles quadrilineatus TaxID=74068 RepID=UPI0023E338BB|nr:protein quick-to-court-like isoform X1 [Macrosteles quadrilineatus]
MNSKSESRIPVMSPSPLRRSGSMRLGGCPPIQEHRSNTSHRPVLNRHRSLQSLNTATSFSHDLEDDAASVQSFSSVSGASVCSNMSQCDHAHFARNGTTYSGRSKRYVYHCSPHSMETDDYLTPTQRTNRTIRKLRNLLKEAQEELADKDREIQRLTKEVLELKLLKADSGGEGEEVAVEQSSGGGDAQQPRTPGYSSSPPLIPSLTDSGHFEDLNSSQNLQTYINQIKTLESTLESLHRQHQDEIRELKEKHNDKVDSLLQRITDVNDRYYALRPLYEDCKEKLHELEKLNDNLENGSNHNYVARITELENLNQTLSCDKQLLVAELASLNNVKEELVATKVNLDQLREENTQLHNKKEELTKVLANMQEKSEENTQFGNQQEELARLLVKVQEMSGENTQLRNKHEELTKVLANMQELSEENIQLRNKQEELTRVLANMQESMYKDCNNLNGDHLEGISHTESLCNGIIQETIEAESSKQADQTNVLAENVELKKQIEAYAEKFRQMEEQQQKEKDIYVQLYQKGIQAAKMLDSDDVQSVHKDDSQSSLVPDLLEKLRIKQDELDNLKDKDFVSPYNLLSAKEAISLWQLVRKAMYRRLLESRKEAPKHDPEMTLQFLKSAFYYFLTDRENASGHLAAIESILGFSDNEKINIERAFLWR